MPSAPRSRTRPFRGRRAPARVACGLAARHSSRPAAAVVTYGPRVSRYVQGIRGARGNVFEAPQAVSAEQFGAQAEPRRLSDGFTLLFAGRLEREKGVE